MAGPVTLEFQGKVAVITIDNEHKLNALNQDGYYQLASHMREVAEHDEVFVTVLTGKGTSIPSLFRTNLTFFPGRYFSA
jgi:Delta3-Delta2-enoyl-CoA isomerase